MDALYRIAAGVVAACLMGCGGSADSPAGPVAMELRFENTTEGGALVASDGSRVDILFAPGVWAVSEAGEVLFVPGARASEGLERLAEDGQNFPLLGEVREAGEAYDAGTFGAFDEGVSYDEMPIGPATPPVTFELEARPGARLSFASMFVQSNDLFVAPEGGSLALFDEGGHPVEGDVTGSIRLWDAGTEENEEPGIGANQAPRQDAPEQGAVEDASVHPVDGTDAAGYEYPSPMQMLRVTLSAVTDDAG